ncbi:DEAD/DEAH box helicase [Amaricoccus sp. W119]|uniref:DEAD/DEAH box helicase n=1 Tax=Amaricoccus sp. W119 TaxID=3391833 RepID=UPI0039A633E9
MTKFNDLALDPKVLKAVSEAGYETPTPIQVQAIPHALEGRDVLGIAQTGTGKTASFVLPMITHLSKGRARARMPRSLVLAPTRELAAQVAENFEKYSKHVKLSMALLIGGVSFKDQDKLIDRGVDVLIATPGRLLDHFERGKLMLTGVQIMVVDEADRMLDMGFIPDIERIFKLVPFTRQTLFFSATMAPEITRITQEFLHNPVRVEVARQATTSETIDQYVCKHTPKRRDGADRDKREVLRRLIRGEGETLTNGIIFCNRKRDVDVVAKSLKKHGFDAAPLHGDLEQSMRMKILGDFRDGALKVLVASDVAARGLDIPSVSHVINFDVPIHSEDYVHRIGRTGRAGRAGKAITICFPHEEKYLAKIEELVKKSIPILPSPLGAAETAGDEETDAAAPAPRRSERARRSESRRPEARAGDDRGDTRTRTQSEPSRPEPSRTRGDKAERGGRQGRREDRSSVVGMGDHVPAFLMREFRLDPPLAATPTAPEPAAKPTRRRAAAKADPVEVEAAVAAPMVEDMAVEDAANGTAAEVTASEPAAETPAASAESRAAETPEASVPEAEAGATDVLPTEPVEAETVAAEAGAEGEAKESPTPAKKPRAPRRRVTARAKAAEVEQTAPAA